MYCIDGNAFPIDLYNRHLREALHMIRRRQWIAELFCYEEETISWLVEQHQQLKLRPHLTLAIGKTDLILTQLYNLVTHNARPRPKINDEVDDGDEEEWTKSHYHLHYLCR